MADMAELSYDTQQKPQQGTTKQQIELVIPVYNKMYLQKQEIRYRALQVSRSQRRFKGKRHLKPDAPIHCRSTVKCG